MSFETDVITKYESTVGVGRLFWDESDGINFAADYIAPYVVVEQTSGDTRQFVDNEPSEDLYARLTFTTWGSRRTEVSEKMRELANVIIASSTDGWVVVPLGGMRGETAESLGLRGAAQDFGVWYKYPAP